MSTHEPAEGADHLAAPDVLSSTGDQRALEHAAAVRAFSGFYREAVKPLIGYLIVSGAPAPIAAEIAQDCMIELFRRWAKVSHPKAYVYRVAGRMWVRRVANTRMEDLVEELPEPTSLLPKPDALVEFESHHEVLQVLKRLPPRQRQVLFLTLEHFTPTQIAEQLELEPGTVRAHLMRARRTAAAHIKGGQEQ